MAQALEAVAVLRQECKWYAKGVDELCHATGGRTVIIYECYDGSGSSPRTWCKSASS